MKHTQGEWKATGLEIRHKDRSLILANVYEHLPVNQSRTEAEANAKLIASAPVLLEALQTIKTFIDSSAGNPCPEPIRRLISKESEIAIKKATE